ncbi:MAG: hypothetical protein QM516_00415, partial [Limnohabitans sp.]|nr:hypothetical protein [Limnohabitans sp.]
QEGVGCGSKQLSGTAPQLEQNVSASATHSSSHATPQQAGSAVQTSSQQSGLEHPGPRRLTTKQLLGALAQAPLPPPPLPQF